MRASGILLPIFSLPSSAGPGGFTRSAYQFIDFLQAAGQKIWQVLPLNPPAKGSSPYTPSSCFAGNPAFIDPEALVAEGLLTDAFLSEWLAEEKKAADQESGTGSAPASGSRRINYAAHAPIQDALLREAFRVFRERSDRAADQAAFESFCQEQADWLEDTALFYALEREYPGKSWLDWPAPLAHREETALSEARARLTDEIDFVKWVQFEFFRQWGAVREYARARGLLILGDLPIYTALESCDCWAHPAVFQLGPDGRPVNVSGCPPDGFAPRGQFWGNPLYAWADRPEPVFQWWLARIRSTLTLFDAVRIDHFRGFEAFFSIPAATGDPAQGKWVPGPGLPFFQRLEQALTEEGLTAPTGFPRFVAEDLGYLTPEVYALLNATGFPGMKVLQFAFDGTPDNPYLPGRIGPNSLVYTGTHDNDTSLGWMKTLPDWARAQLRQVLAENLPEDLAGPILARANDPAQAPAALAEGLVLLAEFTAADTCLIPLQDWLGLDSGARINVPSVPYGNWAWQVSPADLGGRTLEELAGWIREITRRSGRLG